jgi:hypothetical protein
MGACSCISRKTQINLKRFDTKNRDNASTLEVSLDKTKETGILKNHQNPTR